MDTPAPSRHERRRLQTRQLLVETTLKLILDKGYDAISIQDITDRADLGRGTFYIHFKDKGDVVWTAFKDLFQELEQEAHKKIDRRLPQMEYYGLLSIFRHVDKNRDLYRVMFGRQGSALLTARVQDLLAEVFLYDIRHAPARPAARAGAVDFNLPDEFEAQLLTGVVTRLLLWWLEGSNRYTAEQMASMTYKALYREYPPAAAA